jgi:polyphosphate kinase 2
MGKDQWLSAEDLKHINSKDGIYELLNAKKYDLEKVLEKIRYKEELEALQAELVRLQNSMIEKGDKLLIIFEGRDAAGKGGAIQRFTKTLMPRHHRVVALPKPSDVELGQWYFQRYVNQLPTEGEIVLFDRSWYNRAVVEPVNGFCNKDQYERFMRQVNDFEKMLLESGLKIVKFWLDIDKDVQADRFKDRKEDPLKRWKISPVDAKAQELWDRYTHYQQKMFDQTNSEHCPWVILQANDKKKTRLEVIRYVLNKMEYDGKKQAEISLDPNLDIVHTVTEYFAKKE